MNNYQQTIKKEVELSGCGLFLGEKVSLRLKPAPINSGIRFIRVDLPGTPSVQADVHSIANDSRRVFLKRDGVEIESIEHLMACLSGLGIDNLEIEINGREVPACDGSSYKFVSLLMEAGIVRQKAPKNVFTCKDKIVISDGKAGIAFIPDGNGLTVSYTMDFDGAYLNKEEYSIKIDANSFCNEIASARTFGLISNVKEFKQLGIGKGVTDDNSLIVHKDGQITKPLSMSPAILRFPNECIRHKILDIVGDLYLSNLTLNGHIVAKRTGHFLNTRMAKKIVEIANANME